MSLLHPALLLGLLLTAVPVVLHLLMRARPKKLDFPALRLLQQRRIQNQRRMRLRHLWLLLLRMAVIAGLVLALVRPSLPPANYALSTWEISSLAAIVSLALAAYFTAMTHWSRSRLPQHTLLSRRTYLRGGLGLATVLLALLLVGWPYQRRVAAEITSPAPSVDNNLPVAAVFLCDTSLSSSYVLEGATRLEAARRIAVTHLQRLPAGSVAAVFDLSGELPAVMTVDLAAVQNRLEALTPQPVVQSLNDQLRAAIRFQEDERGKTIGEQVNVAEGLRQDRFVREIYVFTDLAKSAWRPDETKTLQTQLSERDWLGMYVIDVGVERPTNTGIVDVRLSRQTVGVAGQVDVEATVRRAEASASDTVVEFWQATDDGPLAKRGTQTVSLSKDQAAKVRFSLDNVAGKLAQGSLKLVTSDPLSMDDAAHFSVKVLPPLNVLVVAPDRRTAETWMVAIDGLNAVGSAYRGEYVAANRFTDARLDDVDVVCLINAPAPAEADWEKLTAFAESGGGVLVCLGAPSSASAGTTRGIDPVAYSTDAALKLLPVRPKASLRFSTPQHLNFRDSPHPLTQRLEALGVLASLGDIDFRRYWSVELRPAAATLARWTDDVGLPAFVTGEVGRGRCAVFTSSVDSPQWSDLPRQWMYIVLADQWLQLLSRQAAGTHTFLLGDPVVMPIDVDPPVAEALLRQPDLTQRRIEVARATQEVTINDARLAGHYQLVTAGPSPQLLTGFSENVSSSESDLTRLRAEELDDLLGRGRYSIARDPEQLTRSVLAGRLGQEVSGLLLTLLVVIFVVEQSTATWFYRQDEPS